MSAYVYRIRNADGVLLYIGSTIQPEGRMTGHAKHARWWHKAEHFEFEPFATEGEAREAERAAILAEFPRWNIRDRSPLHPDGYAASYMDVLAIYPDDCRWGMGHESPFIEWHRERRARRLAREQAAA